LEIAGDAHAAEPVTIAGTGVAGAGAIRSVSGGNTLGVISLSGDASIAVDSGSLEIGNVGVATGAASAALAKTGNGSLVARRYRVDSIDVSAGTAAVGDGRSTDQTSRVGAIAIANGARLDTAANDVVVDYAAAGPTPQPALVALLVRGYHGGDWGGDGLTSRAAAAASATPHRTAIGYAEAADLGIASFSGQTVDASAVLLRYTFAGDSNLDGTVNLTDFTFLAANFNKTGGATWLQGDYNYDGNVDLTDFTFLAGNFNQSLPLIADGDYSLRSCLGSSVPEPISISLATVVLTPTLIARRRRRVARIPKF
jgi:hypothetical protein